MTTGPGEPKAPAARAGDIEREQAIRCPYCGHARFRFRMVMADSLVVECKLCERDATLYWEGILQ